MMPPRCVVSWWCCIAVASVDPFFCAIHICCVIMYLRYLPRGVGVMLPTLGFWVYLNALAPKQSNPGNHGQRKHREYEGHHPNVIRGPSLQVNNPNLWFESENCGGWEGDVGNHDRASVGSYDVYSLCKYIPWLWGIVCDNRDRWETWRPQTGEAKSTGFVLVSPCMSGYINRIKCW